METHIAVSKDSNNVNVYLRNEGSFYNEETERRELKENVLNYHKISQIIKDYTRQKVKKDVDKMIDSGEMLYIKDEDVYVILEPQGSWISLEGKFVKEMVRTFNNRTNSIYYWLYRRWHQKKVSGEPCLFSLGDICDFLALSDHSKNRREVDKCLAHLAAVGLIQYQIIRQGKTYLRKLTYIGTKLRVLEASASVSEALEKKRTDDAPYEKVLLTIGYGEKDTKALEALKTSLLRDFNG